ncbi:hypothetical protein K3495_g6081 [Podosphaera aphanis]|nr:hypothetical protein K3495_g6081 [Podosphaera aphanis]
MIMTSTPGPAHRTLSNIRSPEPAVAPQTPLRNRTTGISFGSPSALRVEEECVILELGTRYLRAGLAGSAVPQAIVNFSPEQHRRAGDLRRWSIGYDSSVRSKIDIKEWGEANELWRLDLRDLDLGLISDKIERAVRDAFTKTLLVDSRPRRFSLILPSILPLPLLSTILDTLFSNFQPPSISLMSAPALATLAAGLRSALVVDIGWAETVVTSVYEFREVDCLRSIRASKMLGKAAFRKLSTAISKLSGKDTITDFESQPSFEECEEVIERLVWCKTKRSEFQKDSYSLTTLVEENEPDALISLPLNSAKPPRTVQIPFSDLSEPCESALFATGIPESELDDEELPLHLLIYQSLLKLPIDVRSICMARILFVGGASQIPGLKARVMQELNSLVETRKWNPVKGAVIKKLPRTLKFQEGQNELVSIRRPVDIPLRPMVPVTPTPQDIDPIEEKIKRGIKKQQPAVVAGNLRVIKSLGAWAGGSLASQLKIQAVSVIEREQWIQHGILGATKIGEPTAVPQQRQSMGPGAMRSGAGDRSSWTLGLWG